MLLQSITATNNQGDSLTFPVDDPSAEVFVRNATGLSPVKATLASSPFASQDGARFHSGRRETRNPVLTLGVDPEYTNLSVYDLRRLLYTVFMPNTEVTLDVTMFDRFSTNIIAQTLTVRIVGTVESCDVPQFTKEPTATVSIMCWDPKFEEMTPIVFDGFTTDGLTETVVPYEGSVETGFLFQLFSDRVITDFAIYHRTPDNRLHTVNFTKQIGVGEVVKISSVPGDKYVNLLTGGVEGPILYAITTQSDWLKLYPGDNNIRVYVDDVPVPWSITYTRKYGGL